MRYLISFFIFIFLGGGAFFILAKNNSLEILAVPESKQNLFTATSSVILKESDIEPQKPLANPPKEIKAVYVTSWSAGSEKKMDYLIKLIKETELNAVVVDVKDFSGYVAYDIKLPDVEKYKAKQIKIKKINALIKRLHDEGIYTIARITIFQDPVLAKAHPDWAINSKSKLLAQSALMYSSSTLWLDHKNLAWMDPAAREVWDYNIAIAKDASERGFDELNFDYIRFPSDGGLYDMKFPVWDETSSKREVMKSFFKYLREQLPNAKISADLFGLATIESTDLGIGQIIEDAYGYFDYIAPMIYPSHYGHGTLGYKNPAEYPYEIVKYSMDSAITRIATSTSQLRPWLQDFDLGADYDAEKVKQQINAVYDAASSTPESINGYMLWNPSNIYTKDALNSEL